MYVLNVMLLLLLLYGSVILSL